MSTTEEHYKRLCEFELNKYEPVTQSADKLLQHTDRLLRTKKYPSYKALYEGEYKNKFKQSVQTVDFKELQKELPKDTLQVAFLADKEVKALYDMKERDLDGDGVPDRIDIDDKNNAVQTVSDLSEVRNSTNKATQRDIEDAQDQQEKKRKKSHEMEL